MRALHRILAASPSRRCSPPSRPSPRRRAAPATVDVRSQLPDTARKAWDAAKQLAGASDYKGALVEFQRAYELSHNPRVLYNVGVTEKLLTHYARAVDAWDKEQREGAGQLVAAELQELKNAIAIVQQFVTTIDVTANEADATLSIDDYPVGKTPFAGPVRIDVGKHVLKLSKDGFVDAVEPVDVAAGARTPVTFKLEPVNKTALVSVTVGGAPAATVFVDGKDMGPAPFKGELSADRHTIEARAPGFVTVGQTVDVMYKQPMSLVLTLSAGAPRGTAEGDRPGGRRDRRRREAASAPATWEGVVSTTGGHQLVVTKPGYQTYSTEVFVADDQVREVNVPLNARGEDELGRVGRRVAARRDRRHRRRLLRLQALGAGPDAGHADAAPHDRQPRAALLGEIEDAQARGGLARVGGAGRGLGRDGERLGLFDEEADRARAGGLEPGRRSARSAIGPRHRLRERKDVVRRGLRRRTQRHRGAPEHARGRLGRGPVDGRPHHDPRIRDALRGLQRLQQLRRRPGRQLRFAHPSAVGPDLRRPAHALSPDAAVVLVLEHGLRHRHEHDVQGQHVRGRDHGHSPTLVDFDPSLVDGTGICFSPKACFGDKPDGGSSLAIAPLLVDASTCTYAFPAPAPLGLNVRAYYQNFAWTMTSGGQFPADAEERR